jgi:hypothetical protein
MTTRQSQNASFFNKFLEGEARRNESEISSPPQPRTALPQEVKIVRWELLASPVRLNRCTTVFDTEKFAACTLRQLRARLRGDNWALATGARLN